MATQTLAQAALFIDDQIVKGIVQDFIDINPLFDVLPFTGYSGQAMVLNRELTLGTVELQEVGDTITAKTPATFTQQTFTATRLIGDAEMDNLVQAQSISDDVDQTAIEIQSKAKNIARTFQQGMATGDGSAPNMNSFHSMCDATQYTTASAGQALSFALLDELCDLVKSKNGTVDFLMMPARTIRSYKALLRGLGGTPADWVVELPGGRKVIHYEDIPIFKNEFLSVTETANGAALTTGALTSVWAGCFDDGSGKVGIAGIHPISVPAGIQAYYVGEAEDADMEIYRVKQYANFALFNRKGLARLPSINN